MYMRLEGLCACLALFSFFARRVPLCLQSGSIELVPTSLGRENWLADRKPEAQNHRGPHGLGVQKQPRHGTNLPPMRVVSQCRHVERVQRVVFVVTHPRQTRTSHFGSSPPRELGAVPSANGLGRSPCLLDGRNRTGDVGGGRSGLRRLHTRTCLHTPRCHSPFEPAQ